MLHYLELALHIVRRGEENMLGYSLECTVHIMICYNFSSITQGNNSQRELDAVDNVKSKM